MLQIGGLRVLTRRARPGIARPSQWFPFGEKCYLWRLVTADFVLLWKPHKGLCALSSSPVGSPGTVGIRQYVNLESQRMKKLSIGAGEGAPLPPLSSESVILKKLPRLCEFLTNTAYEDGSPRSPGRLWIDNDGIAFTITLFEPSAFARVRIRGNTLDDALALANTHLGMENAPWEADQYARDKAAQKKKK